MAELDPLRAPDWRYRRSRELFESRAFVSPRDFDLPIVATVAYLRARPVSAAASDQSLGARGPVATALAFRIRYSAPRLAAALESMVLGNLAPDEIAQKLGVSAETVTVYEAVFFDVRSRLNATTFIIQNVIDASRRRNPDDAEAHCWRSVAYLGGQGALKRAMCETSIASADDLLVARRSALVDVLECKLHTAAASLPAENVESIRRALQFVHERIDASGITPLNEYEANIKAFLHEFPFTVGPGGVKGTPLEEFEGCAAELRADQMIAVARGEKLPDAEEIKAKRMPPPRKFHREPEL